MKPTRERLAVTATMLFPSGAWECVAMVDNQRISKTYLGYTRREAVTEFRRHVRTSTP